MEIGSHFVTAVYPFLYAPDRVSLALTCKEFHTIIQPILTDIIIPSDFEISDANLIPIIGYAINMRHLTIQFPPIDADTDALTEDYIRDKLLKNMQSNMDESKEESTKDASTDTSTSSMRRIDFPQNALNASYFPQLKRLQSLNVRNCGGLDMNRSEKEFYNKFIFEMSKLLTLQWVGLPHICVIRHNCIEVMDLKYCQIGFDGMNVHIGSDLIGITHFKQQLPSIHTVYTDELYLFIGEDIYENNEKSGKQYWVVMNKWCCDTGVKVRFRDPKLAIMLMPSEKKTPTMHFRTWDDLEPWMTERVSDFIGMV